MFYAALDITAVNKEGVTAKMLIDMYIKFVHLRSLHGTFTFKIRVQNWTVYHRTYTVNLNLLREK